GLAVGVRPEAVRIEPAGIRAAVIAVEYLGADTLVETRIGDSPFVVRLAGRTTAKPGEDIGVVWEPEACHWFDLESGRRIDA
ncbi:MAG: TOBE domain-containing protein, partial [Pseudomonadota bacterium]|nr:TOBE domain-containing protein [Pseudomonadota bacterium]